MTVAGLVGSGKAKLARVLFGLEAAGQPALAPGGAPDAPHGAAEAIAAGAFLCGRDRAGTGVVPAFDMAPNLSLPGLERHATGGFVRTGAERSAAGDAIGRMGIVRTGPRAAIGALSGGSQRKVMLERWLTRPCRLLILDEPFQGVDIGARRDLPPVR